MITVAAFNKNYISEDEVDDLEVFLLDIMRQESLVDDGVQAFPELASDDNFMTFAYLISGESEKALKLIETGPEGDHDSFYLLWTNLNPMLRQHPYFLTFIRNTGLYDFWLKEGWPDKCQPEKKSKTFNLKCH